MEADALTADPRGKRSGYTFDGICASVEFWARHVSPNEHGMPSLMDAAELLRSQRAEIERLRTDAERDAKLLWGLVHNVKGKRGSLRWAVVRDAVACGSTWASDLCRRFDADPDVVWTGSKWKADAADTGAQHAD